jgi:hypothetical protein
MEQLQSARVTKFFTLLIRHPLVVVLGKTMENIRRRKDIRLKTESKAIELAKKPNYDHHTIMGKNLIAVHRRKKNIHFDKPIYVGKVILDLSKLHMMCCIQ